MNWLRHLDFSYVSDGLRSIETHSWLPVEVARAMATESSSAAKMVELSTPLRRGYVAGFTRMRRIPGVYGDGSAERHRQCVKPYAQAHASAYKRTKKKPVTYQVTGAYTTVPGYGIGTATYERGLQALAERNAGPVIIVAEACTGGSTTDDAKKVYGRLHRAGYDGAGWVVSSLRRDTK